MMREMAKRRIDILVFFVWLVSFFFLSSKHVPWRDEFQSWLVSTRTPNLKAFVDALTYERTPSVLYVLQRVLHALPGASRLSPVTSIRLVTGSFAVAAAFLWIFKLDVPLLARYLFPFSLPFLREYSVISRSYVIGVFFLFLGVLYFRRKQIFRYWTCVVLAAGTQPLFTLAAGGLLGMNIWDLRREIRKTPKRFVLPLGLVAMGFCIHLWTQIPPVDSAFPSGHIHLHVNLVKKAIVFLVYGLMGIERSDRPFAWNFIPWSVDSAFVVLVLLGALGKRDKFPFGRFFLVAGPPVLVLAGIYGFGLRHAAIVLIAFVVVSLLYWPKRAQMGILMVPMALATWGWIGLWKPYLSPPAFDQSGSAELVSTIGDRLSADRAVLVVGDDTIYFPVMALKDIPVFDARRDRFLYYPYFRASEWRFTLATWCRVNKEHASERFPGKTLFIGMRPGIAPPPECGCVKKVFETRRPVATDEAYSVYQWVPESGSCRG